ncbi:hypothetical protein IFR05_004798 [Cadophora sp. M221]|nr:hypothetical protein IFR05_004798 [Cadophora sp. M221]
MHFLHSQLLIGSIFITASVQTVSHVQQSPGADITTCLTVQKVPFIVKTSSNWTNYVKTFNLRLIYQPAVITIPETPEQVSSSVICAAASNLKVQARGGGHSYASHPSGGRDGLPHGTCSGVGIAGHALHGGYGYASRNWGITLDTIVGLDVVLANGTQVHTTATSYPDLFYAMRGAGESFGIVTCFYLQTQPAPSSVLFFSAYLAASLKNVDIVTSGFERLQNLSLTSPLITPNITFGMYTDSGEAFSLSGWCMDCNAAVFSEVVLPAILEGFPGRFPTSKPKDGSKDLQISQRLMQWSNL